MAWIQRISARRAAGVAAACLLWASPAIHGAFTTVKFPSADGLLITADLYEVGDKSRSVMVLFHQSRSSRGEYRQIAPELVKQGFNAFAVDLRWGGTDPWNGVVNETSARNGTDEIIAGDDRGRRKATILSAETDMAAALRWLRANGYTGPLVVWGSSFSAMLVYELAAEEPDLVAAVVAYSPGEYDDENPDRVQGWARKVAQPVYVACGMGREEQDLARPIYEAVPHAGKTLHCPGKGRHGASILLDAAANWDSVKRFLTGLDPS